MIRLFTAATLLLVAATAHATVVIEPRERRPLPPTPGSGVTIESLSIDLDIEDGVARTTVHEVVRNPGPHGLEVRFVLPIPRDAVVHDASLKVGDTWVEAEVLDADEARRAYRDIVRRRIDPALIEYVDAGLLRTHVFPIPPGTTRELRLTLTTDLTEDFGTWVTGFPLRAAMGRARPGQVEVRGSVRSQRELELPFSPTHHLDARLSADRHRADFTVDVGRRPQDLQVFLPTRQEGLSIHVASTRPGRGDGFVMVRVTPGTEAADASPLPRRMVFVLDVSGSMQGDKLRQAKEALRYCLRSLDERDRFALITYEAGVNGLTEGLVAASDDHVDEALRELDRVQAGGGTNLHAATLAALDLVSDASRDPAYVLLLSDGLPTVGVKDIDRILQDAEKANRGEARLFTFGVGEDLDARLMDDLARRNGATPRYVLPGEDLEVALTNLARQIAEPVWTDLELALDGARLYDAVPARLGDLFRGESVTVVARYRHGGRTRLELTGQRAGDPRRERRDVVLADHATGHGYLPRLWASRKIAVLQTELRHAGGRSPELRDAIRDLGLRYGILTEETSLLMREPATQTVGTNGLTDYRVEAVEESGVAPRATAVRKAARESRATRSQSLADAAELEAPSMAWDEDSRGRPAVPTIRRVGGRVLHLTGDDLWEDPRAKGFDTRLVVRTHSDAWFRLVALRPDLRELLGAAESLRIRLGEHVLETSPDRGVERALPERDRDWLAND